MTDYLTAEEVAGLLKISRKTFDTFTRHLRGFPDPIKASPRRIRWSKKAIDAWCEAQSNSAISAALSA